MATLANTKSLRKGEISLDKIREILSISTLKKNLIEYHLTYAQKNDMDCDTVVCEGDLVIDGNFSLSDVCNLIVTGSLTVNGLLEHYDEEPATYLFVGGNLKAKDLVTGGTLEVHGNVEIENALVGDYNDYSATILGNVSAAFFFPENHYFDIKGTIDFKQAYGSSHQVNANKNDINFMTERDFYHLINHKLLEEPVDEEEAAEMDDEDDYYDCFDRRAMHNMLREGKSIFKK